MDVTAAPPTSYPSSHRKAQHDWNKLEADVKAEEKDEKLDGDAGLQKFFSQLYSGADEDTRRAMNKSFQVCTLRVSKVDQIGGIRMYSSHYLFYQFTFPESCAHCITSVAGTAGVGRYVIVNKLEGCSQARLRMQASRWGEGQEIRTIGSAHDWFSISADMTLLTMVCVGCHIL